MSLKRQVDQLEQKQERRNSVRITGIDKPQPVPESGMPVLRTCKLAVQTMVREKSVIDVDDRDLEDAYTVGPPDKNRRQTMIVRFASNYIWLLVSGKPIRGGGAGHIDLGSVCFINAV